MRLFTGSANKSSKAANHNNFCGIKLIGGGNIDLISLGHQFDGVVDGLNVYVYDNNFEEILHQTTIDHAKSNRTEWSVIGVSIDIGEGIYIGYKQSELLNAQALIKELVWNKKPCICDSEWSKWYKEYSKTITVHGFETPESDLGSENLDVGLNRISNYGLNLEFSL